jgi:glutamate racemase
MKNIGFFDSGMGGLTVLHEALRVLPHEDFIYFADSKNAPYGNKPKELVKKLTFEAIDFMVKSHQLKALVVACNTATSVAIDDLRQKYTFPIVGIEPAVKPALGLAENKKVLVFATEMTLKEAKFKNLVAKFDTKDQVDYVPLQDLVGIAERFEFDEKIILPYLQKQLAHLQLSNYGAMVLGCTHFPFFKPYFRKLIPENVQLVDGSEGTVKQLKRLLSNELNIEGGSVKYYISGKSADSEEFEKYLEIL